MDSTQKVLSSILWAAKGFKCREKLNREQIDSGSIIQFFFLGGGGRNCVVWLLLEFKDKFDQALIKNFELKNV